MTNIIKNNYPKSFDTLRSFIFNKYEIRGEIVQTKKAYEDLIQGHEYPTCIKKLLGEMQAGISLITATLKFKGSIMLQLRGNSKLRYAYINSNEKHETNGLASTEGDIKNDDNWKDLIGKDALLTITVIPEQGNQYQGIIDLDKPDLAGCIEEYYKRSVQIDTKIFLFSDPDKMTAAGILIQNMPSNDKIKAAKDFEHVSILICTATTDEMLTIDSQDMLYRLFNQESVNIFDPCCISFKCICSQQYFHEMLSHIPSKELKKMLEQDGKITTTCHCCGKSYTFDKTETELIIKESADSEKK